jgi:hypothetical protein
MIENALYQLLTSDTNVAALLGDPTGVYFSFAPRQYKPPCIVMHRVSTVPIVTLDATADLLPARYQFDCYSGDALSAGALADAVYFLLRDFNGAIGSPPDIFIQACVMENIFDLPFEQGAKDVVYRTAVDVTIWFVPTT